MRKTTLALLASFFIFVAIAQAQYQDAPNGFAFRWTWNNFQYPITQDLSRYDYTSGAELTYLRHLNNHLNLAIPLKIGSAELPLDDQGSTRDVEIIGSLDALLHLKFFKKNNLVYPYLLAGAGLMSEPENDWKMNPEFPAGLGINFRVAPHLYLSAETQYRFSLTENRNQLQHAAGIWMILGGYDEEEKTTDADKDGIPDEEDKCPDEPGVVSAFGCPDSDGDGVADKIDDCPTQAGLAALNGCPDRDGDNVPDHQDNCPDEPGTFETMGCPNTDRDGDGVNDQVDRCPDEPGTPFTAGCPDQDGDRVADFEDKCPTQPGIPQQMGCPDTDNDGIIDPNDKCPNTPGPAANNGCPELKPAEKEVLEFAMRAVQFETGSARLLAASNQVLDEIAGILRNYPDHKLRIGGHTDSIGSFEENQQLSERRAKACFDYLVSKGITASRISYQGFGESKPIADNRFAPGREKNRRVEFEVYVD